MDIQARVPTATAAMHNFILEHDSAEWDTILRMDVEDPNPGTWGADGDFGALARGATSEQEKERSEDRRDGIADAMWESYQNILRERGEDLD